MGDFDDHPAERKRVYDRIAPAIIDFARNNPGLTFHAEDLRDWVTSYTNSVAPSSADRVLRLLKEEGKVYYTVINRRESLYQFPSTQEAPMDTVSMEEKPADLIDQYVNLRDQRQAADATFAEFRKEEYDIPMNTIEMKLLDMLNKMGSDSIKAKTGTAYKKASVSITTADAAEWRRHVIGLRGMGAGDVHPGQDRHQRPDQGRSAAAPGAQPIRLLQRPHQPA